MSLHTPRTDIPTPPEFGSWKDAYQHLINNDKGCVRTSIDGVKTEINRLETVFTMGEKTYSVAHIIDQNNIELLEERLAREEREGRLPPPAILDLVWEQLIYADEYMRRERR